MQNPHRLGRSSREDLLLQKAKVIWLTGLPCSGKSTLAFALERSLYQNQRLTYVLDGDILRAGINSNLGYSSEDRKENIRRAAEIAKILADAGAIVICSFISPTEEIRQLARKIIGTEDFVEVYIEASIALCERRDVKGLYAKARRGEISEFTGVSAPFEIPLQPDFVVNTELCNEEDCTEQLLQYLAQVDKRIT